MVMTSDGAENEASLEELASREAPVLAARSLENAIEAGVPLPSRAISRVMARLAEIEGTTGDEKGRGPHSRGGVHSAPYRGIGDTK